MKKIAIYFRRSEQFYRLAVGSIHRRNCIERQQEDAFGGLVWVEAIEETNELTDKILAIGLRKLADGYIELLSAKALSPTPPIEDRNGILVIDIGKV